MLNRTLRESFCEELVGGFPGGLKGATAMAERDNGGYITDAAPSPRGKSEMRGIEQVQKAQ